MQNFNVDQDTTLLEFLRKLFPQSSSTRLRELISQGRCTCSGRAMRRADTPIRQGQQLSLLKKEAYHEQLTSCGKLIYRDQHLIVFDKKCGILSVDSDYAPHNSLHEALKRAVEPQRVFVLHRLDKETSGLIIYPTSQTAFAALKEELYMRRVKRRYLALVEGHIEPKEGSWSSFLREDSDLVVRSSRQPNGGELAITHYRVLNTKGRRSLIELELETGKKNQIRVHCQEASAPIIGDVKYGGIKNKRMMLHAHELIFTHPITGKLLTFNSPAPF